MSKTKTHKPDHVPFGQLLAWQTRPISLGAVTIIIGYLSLYCTNMLQMDPMLVGALIMASKIFDGVTDLFAGWLVDNTKTKLGKGRPYELCIIGVWICMYALFATSVAWSTVAKSIWIFIMYSLIFSVFTTLLNASEAPYVIRSFGSKLAVTKVSAYGGIFITIGCMVVSISFPMLIATMGTTPDGWRRLLAMFAIPLTLLGLLRFLIVKEKYVSAEDENRKLEIKDILIALTSNRYIWFLGVASAIPQLITAMAVNTYYFQDYVGDISLLSGVQAVGMLGLVVMIIFPTLMKKFSAMDIVCGVTMIGIVGYVLNFFAGANMPLLCLGFFLGGLASLPLAYMRVPIIMQISDYNETRGMARMEGTIGSAVNFICKLGQGIGSLLIGAVLSMGGYNGAAAVQSDSALMAIKLSYSILPALLLIPVILSCIAFKPLDKMQKEQA